MIRLKGVAIGGSLILAVGCGTGGENDSGESEDETVSTVASGDPTSGTPGGPILLTAPGPTDGGMQARIEGTVEVRADGCVTLADSVLVAPHRSEVVEDGEAVWLDGFIEQTVRIGERIVGSGGHWPAHDSTLDWQRCTTDPEESFVLLHFIP